MLEVQLQFVRGVPTHGKVEPKLHSGGKPEFYRHYKVELVGRCGAQHSDWDRSG